MQQFKSVYFADYPAESAKKRSLKLAFGSNDMALFGVLKPLSSEDLRRLLGSGSFTELKTVAEAEGLSLNALCLGRLREAARRAEGAQLSLLPEVEPALDRFVDPVQATFRGGRTEPLHDWYPYPEGYSPEFVKKVLDTFAPDATRVLDPFAGAGTTPLTVACCHRQGFYCELNPLLQHLIDTKARILTMVEGARLRLAARLRDLATGLPTSLARHGPDRRLAETYLQTFGESRFFPSDTFDACLRLRSWLDALDCEDPDAASLATVATVAALVPCSNLIRRGDLRFRKGRERDGIIPDLSGEVISRIRSMARDVVRLRSVPQAPLFVAADAKRLGRLADLEIDAIITSPPYLNGTNYYRNTKIELWFLRALRSGRDLAAFRRRTITAGINDVTAGKSSQPVSESVEAVVRTLQERAYDRRIPQMVLNYFADMQQVFDGLMQHAVPSSSLVIDIGDSAYAGVRVDTPTILADLLRSRGWRFSRSVTLRQRLSRTGQPLRQILMVATAPLPSRKPRMIRPSVSWQSKWLRFKGDLPHRQGSFAKRNWGNPLHSLCSYQGKMKPSLAHHLIRTFTKPGDRLLDPFGGVGTIPFEAALNGVTAWSFDISPAAVPIAAAKLRPAPRDACIALVEKLGQYIREHGPTKSEHEDAATIRFNGPLSDYFHPDTFNEVLLARRFFRETPPAAPEAALVFACLLHVLHGNRPYALSRRSHPIVPFSPTGEAVYNGLVEKLERKLARSLTVERPAAFVAGSSTYQDATDPWPQEMDGLDAIVTSPPFFDSTRFYLANWIRLWFAGWTSSDFKERPLAFVDERQKRSFDVYQPVIRQARERLKPGGVCVFHLGRSRKCDMADEVSTIARPWFRNVKIATEDVAHCESHGIRDKGTVSEHSFLVMT